MVADHKFEGSLTVTGEIRLYQRVCRGNCICFNDDVYVKSGDSSW